MHTTINCAFGAGVTLLTLGLAATTAHAADGALPVKDAPSESPKGTSKEKPFEVGITAASLGAFDSNIFDKGKDPTSAAGGEVNVGVGVGVPLSSRVAWASGAGLGSNARQGIDA